ncbi:hypothetical protein Sjap_001900 [Stephania japonica]|uniref:Uncharacterized protein n=1 Tax=Stephania japonica TaxID=461633 RepID=A0AAP0PTP5_9MAGN
MTTPLGKSTVAAKTRLLSNSTKKSRRMSTSTVVMSATFGKYSYYLNTLISKSTNLEEDESCLHAHDYTLCRGQTPISHDAIEALAHSPPLTSRHLSQRCWSVGHSPEVPRVVRSRDSVLMFVWYSTKKASRDITGKSTVAPEACLLSNPIKKSRRMSTNAAAMSATFDKYAHYLNTLNDKRERVVKASRDITINSKKVIFQVHREQRFFFASM